MSEASQRLEQVRRVCNEMGIPFDASQKLAVSTRRAARLLDLTDKAFTKLLTEDGIPIIDLGPRASRILVTDLVELLFRRRVVRTPKRTGDLDADQTKSCRRALQA